MSNEKFLANYPLFASIKCTKTILSQMENNICKIKTKGGNGTGFFSYIPIPDSNEKLTVFITNNHVIDKEILEEGEPIMLTLNDDYDNPNNKYLDLNDRKIYTNKEYDITIIEIIPHKDNIYNFLEIDKQIYQKNCIYNNDSIYIIQNPLIENRQKAVVSYGILNKLIGNEIQHYCNTDKGSSGSPILSLSNNKVIGVHKKAGKLNFQFNLGIYLREPIQEYLNNINIIPIKSKKYEININNEINFPKINFISNKIENLNMNQEIQYMGEKLDKNLNILFKKNNKLISIEINPEKTVQEAIDLYKSKTGQKGDIKLIFNCNYLNKSQKISQSGLYNNCIINII